MKKIKLSNSVEMPQLGYGVYQVEPDPTLPSPRLARIWQDCCTGSLALAVAERCNHHPEDRSQGKNAGESESLRLRT